MSALPVYILIRTSGRPKFFARMMETIKNQTYENIVTIVHTDDPRDEYVTGDMIIRDAAYPPGFGDGTYNLYNNRLLRAIPDGPGWYHFIDDDDEYTAPDVIEKLVASAKRDHVNVARVHRIRGGETVTYPRHWGTQKTFQTEIFFLHTDHKFKGKWWGSTGGDHNYSKQLTLVLPIHWISDVVICRAQESKGFGQKLDAGAKRVKRENVFAPDKQVCVVGLNRYRNAVKKSTWIEHGQYKYMAYADAVELEARGIIKITYPPLKQERPAPRNILNL